MTDEEMDAMRAVLDLRYSNPDDALRRVAEVLRSGNAPRMFFRILAGMIDPDDVGSDMGVKLQLRRVKGAGAPKAKPDPHLGQFMERNIDYFGEKPEAVCAAAQAIFGASRSTCFKRLEEQRAWTAKTDPEGRFAVTARLLRDGGDPEYQPLSVEFGNSSDH